MGIDKIVENTQNNMIFSMFTLIFVLLTTHFTFSSGVNVDQLTCETTSFRCCKNVDYPVWTPIVSSIDATTCGTIARVTSQPWWQEQDDSCKQAFVDAYCLLAVPECCNLPHPVIHDPCESVCEKAVQQCDAQHH